MTYEFLRSTSRYVVVRNEAGQEQWLAHDSGLRMFNSVAELAEPTFAEMWAEYVKSAEHYPDGYGVQVYFVDDFNAALRGRMVNATIPAYTACLKCNVPEFNGEFVEADGQRICPAHAASAAFHTCGFQGCGQLTEHDYALVNRQREITAEGMCRKHVDNMLNCATCQGYYPREDQQYHQHNGSDCCFSPVEEFTINWAGHDPIPNGVITKVSLGEGEITSSGLHSIHTYLWQQRVVVEREQGVQAREDLRSLVNSIYRAELGVAYKNSKGSFAKQVSRHAYNKYKLVIKPEWMTEIGNIAKAHCGAGDYFIETTRLLDQTAAELGNAGSCWWQSFWHSRCIMKSNGGFGMRTYDGPDGDVTGRTWVVPLRMGKFPSQGRPKFEPTFDTNTMDGFLVFNGYGRLPDPQNAALVASMNGMKYVRVETRTPYQNQEGRGLYVNGNSGFLVASDEAIARYTENPTLEFKVKQHSDLFWREQGIEKPKNAHDIKNKEKAHA